MIRGVMFVVMQPMYLCNAQCCRENVIVSAGVTTRFRNCGVARAVSMRKSQSWHIGDKESQRLSMVTYMYEDSRRRAYMDVSVCFEIALLMTSWRFVLQP